MYNFVRGVKRVCRGVYCQQGNIMIRVNNRSRRKIREVEKMNFQAGFLKSAATMVRRNNKVVYSRLKLDI